MSGLEVRREAWVFILSLLPFVHPMFPFSTVAVGVSLMLRVKFKAVERLGLITSYQRSFQYAISVSRVQ